MLAQIVSLYTSVNIVAVIGITPCFIQTRKVSYQGISPTQCPQGQYLGISLTYRPQGHLSKIETHLKLIYLVIYLRQVPHVTYQYPLPQLQFCWEPLLYRFKMYEVSGTLCVVYWTLAPRYPLSHNG
uniref:Uncharacterized protein n=1 Tax=Cacopsylla melanoneura TaxID=428564 RepID=A0A8D8LTN9_9HEMI